jgi:hypothetical protein
MLEYKQFIGIAKLVGHAIKSVIGIMLKPQNPQGNAIKAITRGLWDGFGSQLGKNIEFLPDNK